MQTAAGDSLAGWPDLVVDHGGLLGQAVKIGRSANNFPTIIFLWSRENRTVKLRARGTPGYRRLFPICTAAHHHKLADQRTACSFCIVFMCSGFSS